ncbi:thioredoxin [Deinococcus roseus]|nr:thioredoxin [Deinococcus roseus]
MGKALELTDENFQISIQNGYTLVDFWAPWCPPCRFIGPIIEELASTYEGKMTLGKINVDHNQHTALKYKVMNLPTVILFHNGEVVEVIVGARNKNQYGQAIDRHLLAGV